MKITIYNILILILGVIWLAGCGSSRKDVNINDNDRLITIQDDDLLNNLDEFVRELGLSEQKIIAGDSVESVIQSDSSDLTEEEVIIKKTLEWQQIGGYRVQVAITDDFKMAEDFKKMVLKKLVVNQVVYIVSEGSDYKIRVGDFLTWNEANQCRLFLVGQGFEGSMVVVSEVWRDGR